MSHDHTVWNISYTFTVDCGIPFTSGKKFHQAGKINEKDLKNKYCLIVTLLDSSNIY